jgi:hypothetical protein
MFSNENFGEKVLLSIAQKRKEMAQPWPKGNYSLLLQHAQFKVKVGSKDSTAWNPNTCV